MKIRQQKKDLYHRIRSNPTHKIIYFDIERTLPNRNGRVYPYSLLTGMMLMGRAPNRQLNGEYDHPKEDINNRITPKGRLVDFNLPVDKVDMAGFYYSADNVLEAALAAGMEASIIESTKGEKLVRLQGDMKNMTDDEEINLLLQMEKSFVCSIGAKVRNSSLSGSPCYVPRTLIRQDGSLEVVSYDLVNPGEGHGNTH